MLYRFIGERLKLAMYFNTVVHSLVIVSSFLNKVARSGTELSIQLLGGARRLTPANSHQFPLAVILSGPGKSGAYGLAIARHLAAQGVRTVAYVPEMSVYPSVLASELSLYKLCCKGGSNKNNMLTCSLAELPKTPVDLVNYTKKVYFSMLGLGILYKV